MPDGRGRQRSPWWWQAEALPVVALVVALAAAILRHVLPGRLTSRRFLPERFHRAFM
jgi:hypothetical protein